MAAIPIFRKTSGAQVNLQGGEDEQSGRCQGALTERRTLSGGGALEVGDLRLLEDGSERGGALGSYAVHVETASEGQNGNGESAGVSMGADTKAKLYGAAAHFSSLSTPFPLMQLAIMKAEATPSPLTARSIFSVGFVPLSSSI